MTRLKWILLLTMLHLSGCVSTGTDSYAARLIGEWESNLSGFSFTTRYTADAVYVDGAGPNPYVLEEDLLIVAGDRTTARRIAFVSQNEMTQTNTMTGTVHRYMRVIE